MQIKDLAVGDGFVYLMEGSTKVKFYALSHNYESRLNGKGRTLFCRESPAGSGTHTTSAKEDCRVDSNNEDAWYKNTYVNKFSGEVRKLIGMTKYIGQYVYMTYTQSGDPTGNAEIDSKTYESSFFPLSTAEVGGSNFSDGSALSSAAISRIASIQTRYGSGIWTRSPSRVLTGTNSTGFTKYYYANSQYISGASGSSLSTAEGTPGSSYGYLPVSPCRRRCTSTRTLRHGKPAAGSDFRCRRERRGAGREERAVYSGLHRDRRRRRPHDHHRKGERRGAGRPREGGLRH